MTNSDKPILQTTLTSSIISNQTSCGFVAIVGRPSVGKSSFVNRIVGHKTSIVSMLPQTTQKNIRGIYTENRGQIIFSDTPGLHTSSQKLNSKLQHQTLQALKHCDLRIHMVDMSRLPGPEEEVITQFMNKAATKPTLLVLNKNDLDKTYPDIYTHFFQQHYPEYPHYSVHAISIVTGSGLDELKNAIFDRLPKQSAIYPDDVYTDQNPEFRICEIIREQAISRAKEEVPYAIYIQIADLENHDNQLWIRAFIMVERDSQKGILVGKQGKIIRDIRFSSLKGLKKLFRIPIRLDLQVKVDHKWASNTQRLNHLFKI